MKSTKRFFLHWQRLIIALVVLALAGPAPAMAQGGTWSTKTPMPTARFGPAVCELNGRLHVLGGVPTSPSCSFLTTHEVYDPVSDTWDNKAPMPIPRQQFGVGVINGVLYAVGGNWTCGGNTGNVDAYTPGTNTWTSKAPLSTPRASFGVGVVNGILYAIGGQTNSGLSNKVEAYDPSTNTWASKAPMPKAQMLHAVVVVDNIIYTVGGIDSQGANNTVQAYNPATDTWTTKSPMPTPRSFLAGGAVNGILYAVGGYGGMDTVEAYNPATDTWTSAVPMPTPRAELSAGVISGTLYVVGGFNSSTLATNEAFTPQAANTPPIANAGSNQTVHVGSLVTLDGSGSSDPDGNNLSYFWTLSEKPNGSNAILDVSNSVNPSFTPDLVGDYVITLEVIDSEGLKSEPAKVTISTTNSAPVASAGDDHAVTVIGSTINLNGGESYDPDGDSITYQWTCILYPGDTPPTLSNANSATPSFAAAAHFDYRLKLVVSDGWAQSDPAYVNVKFTNVAPVANAGSNQSVIMGETVYLHGSGIDANDDPIVSYAWDLTTKPGDSAISFSATSEDPSFTPDVPGTYVVQLVVNDGFEDSSPSTVQIQVSASATWLTEQIREVIQIVGGLPPEAFKNKNMRNTFINKLQVVIKQVDEWNYSEALAKLQEDVIAKTNGCAAGGKPDNNDWVIACQYQGLIYPDLMDIAGHLRELAGQ